MKLACIALLVAGAWASGTARGATTPAATATATAQPAPPPPPRQPPPPPATPIPPPPHAQPIEPAPADWNPQAAPPSAPPPGQWVWTNQYGWVFMPYDAAYTEVVPDAALAYGFVYYPAFGWRWVVAPWVLGLGPAPRWGALGPARFAWYARPAVRLPAPFHGRGWPHATSGRRGHR